MVKICVLRFHLKASTDLESLRLQENCSRVLGVINKGCLSEPFSSDLRNFQEV